MSVIDGFRNKFNGSNDEEDFDDFEDEFDDDFEDDEEGEGFFSSLFSRFGKRNADDEYDDQENDDQDEPSVKSSSSRYSDTRSTAKTYDKSQGSEKTPAPKKYESRSDSAKSYGSAPAERKQSQDNNTRTGGARVIPMSKIVGNSSAAKQSSELFMIKPKTEEDARVAVDNLLSGKIVIINLEGLNLEVAQYVTDFVTGANYSIGGNFDTINTQVLVFAPAGTVMSGDFGGGSAEDITRDF